MKYVVFLGDGMSDQPVAGLNGRTPLMAAATPALDRMVASGIGGWAHNTPSGYYPGSDVANLGVLGYDVTGGYSGRSPLEAAAMGVPMEPDDVAFRCNLVTLSEDFRVMRDFSAGHITTAEGARLIEALNRRHGSDELRFYPGVGYRHLLIWRHGESRMRCMQPHDITDQEVMPHLPTGPGAERLWQLMEASQTWLTDHEVNRKRREAGFGVANSIWLWGQGRKPSLPLFQERFGLSGGVISAVDLMAGIAVTVGMERIRVAGATGWIDTNYEGKAQACLDGLMRHDLLFVHVEAPDEAGHAGRLDYKIKAIEDLDARLIGPVLEALIRQGGPFRAMALPDHPTPVELRTHTADPVPVAICGSGILPDQNMRYDESLLQTGSRSFSPDGGLMRFFLSP